MKVNIRRIAAAEDRNFFGWQKIIGPKSDSKALFIVVQSWL
jgi:hypothetical protein